jgi:hypothetical protein
MHIFYQLDLYENLMGNNQLLEILYFSYNNEGIKEVHHRFLKAKPPLVVQMV